MESSDQKDTRKEATQTQPQQENQDRDARKDDQDVCVKAPEWAEHQRLSDDDQPCDDGRSGRH